MIDEPEGGGPSNANDNSIDNDDGVQWIVVDLDGTLADCSHRIDFAHAKDWDSFHAACPEDPVFEDVKNAVISILSFGVNLNVIICTGRNEKYRKQTTDWLSKHGFLPDVLLMRPDNDWSKDGELKTKLLSEHFGSLEEARRRVLFILDDRDSSVEGLRNAGFPVWQVRPSGY